MADRRPRDPSTGGEAKSRIPTFGSLQEEAAFWDAHDITEFEDELETVTDIRFVPAGGGRPVRISSTDHRPAQVERALRRRDQAQQQVAQATGDLDPARSAEKVATWYLRLNGCATIENFVVHPDFGTGQRTDVDIVGVRFPHRQELGGSIFPLNDDKIFAKEKDRIQIILTEVKSGAFQLNRSWTDPNRRVFEEVLRSVGCFPGDMVEVVADTLRNRGEFRDTLFAARLLAIASGTVVANHAQEHVEVIHWRHVLKFIHERMAPNLSRKSSHPQWDTFGVALFESARTLKQHADEFVKVWCDRIGAS